MTAELATFRPEEGLSSLKNLRMVRHPKFKDGEEPEYLYLTNALGEKVYFYTTHQLWFTNDDES